MIGAGRWSGPVNTPAPDFVVYDDDLVLVGHGHTREQALKVQDFYQGRLRIQHYVSPIEEYVEMVVERRIGELG